MGQPYDSVYRSHYVDEWELARRWRGIENAQRVALLDAVFRFRARQWAHDFGPDPGVGGTLLPFSYVLRPTVGARFRFRALCLSFSRGPYYGARARPLERLLSGSGTVNR